MKIYFGASMVRNIMLMPNNYYVFSTTEVLENPALRTLITKRILQEVQGGEQNDARK